jgi:hypothetical protein
VATAAITIAVGSVVDQKSSSITAKWDVEVTTVVKKVPATAVAQQI